MNKPTIKHKERSARYVYDPKHKWRLSVPPHLIKQYRGKQPEAITYVEFITRIQWDHKFNAVEFHNILGLSRQKSLVMLKSLTKKGFMRDLGNKRIDIPHHLQIQGSLTYYNIHEYQADLKAIRASFYNNDGFPTNKILEEYYKTENDTPPTYYKEPRDKTPLLPEVERARQALIKGDTSLLEAVCQKRGMIMDEVWDKYTEEAKAVILANKDDPTFSRQEVIKFYGEKVKQELTEKGVYMPKEPAKLNYCPIRV